MNKVFSTEKRAIQAVFFDLDGTLIASSDDLAIALNCLLSKYNKQPLPIQQIKGYVSLGVAALLNIAFSVTVNHPQFSELKTQYLAIYKQQLSRQCTSYLYPGIAVLLNRLNEKKNSLGSDY